MKQRALIIILALEAALCAVVTVLSISFTGVFSSALAFPFEQLGLGLRVLSLSGAAGNVLAIVLYVGLCLIPAAVMLVLKKRQTFRQEDYLLLALSGALFLVLYLMVNPSMIGSYFSSGAVLEIGKAILGGVVYSVLCGYFVLRVLRLFSAGGTEKLLRYMRVMLGLLAVIFVYLAFGACFASFLDSVSEMRAGNAGYESTLGMSYLFLFLQFAVNAMPYVLDVLVVLTTMKLLREMTGDRYSERSVAAAGVLSQLCVRALAATVISNIAFNILQTAFIASLRVVNATLQIPLFSILFVLAVLLMTKLMAENRELKTDNDMFI